MKARWRWKSLKQKLQQKFIHNREVYKLRQMQNLFQAIQNSTKWFLQSHILPFGIVLSFGIRRVTPWVSNSPLPKNPLCTRRPADSVELKWEQKAFSSTSLLGDSCDFEKHYCNSVRTHTCVLQKKEWAEIRHALDTTEAFLLICTKVRLKKANRHDTGDEQVTAHPLGQTSTVSTKPLSLSSWEQS